MLIAGAGLGMLMGLWTGLARAGVHNAIGSAYAHGIIMALGFLGTLIALERAVALGARWAYLAWVLAAALWTAGRSPVLISPMLAAFLVLTIVVERVELSRLRMPSAASQRRLDVAAGLGGPWQRHRVAAVRRGRHCRRPPRPAFDHAHCRACHAPDARCRWTTACATLGAAASGDGVDRFDWRARHD